ncbi:MAG: phage late control D family protein [Chloroflexi bacterium]|nr:MAG: phage late control D family protein [Chloroflexota bacterium]
MGMEFLSQFFIKIDGRDAPEELVADVVEIVVDTSLYVPEMFTILLSDNSLQWVDSNLLELGKRVEISAKEAIDGVEGRLIIGEITALEPSFSDQGETMVLVRGYNRSHRLHRGRKSRTFLNVTDSDLVRKIAGEVGLSAEVDTTRVTYPYILQNNQTDMEFLAGRAARLGYKFFAAENKLYFKKGDASLGKGPELEFGKRLKHFRPVLSAVHQVDKVTVLGWDQDKKVVIKGQATPSIKQGGISKTGGETARQAFSQAEEIVTRQPVATVEEANALARGVADDIGNEFIQAEGICWGHPKVKAGYTVSIKGVGQRFSGNYFVTSATHIFSEHGYETHFSISGRQPNMTLRFLEPRGEHSAHHLMPGLAIGVVTNIKNTEKGWGYVKVKYPWLGDDIESDWIRMSGPGGGADCGIYWLPEVNDEVLVGFEHGQIHRPYILGGLWNSKDKPPLPIDQAVGSDGKVNQRVIQSRSGHQIIFKDQQKEEQILVKSKSGHQIILDDTGGAEKVTVKDKSGTNQIVLDSNTNTVTIEARQNMTLKCAQKLTLDCTELVVSAKGKGAIKANGGLSLESTAVSQIKGTQVSINGSAQTEVKGGAMVQIQGGMVKIN